MKIAKRLIAIALTAVMSLSAITLTSCADTTWAYKADNVTIPAGLYIMRSMTAYTLAQNHKDRNQDVTNIFKQKLDGVPAKEWILKETQRGCAEYVAIEHKFNELGLTLTDSDNNKIEQQYKESWDAVKAFFEKNGVGEATYRLSLENARKRELIFEKYYDKGGIEEVAVDDLMVHFKENFAAINMFGVKLETGDELTEEQKTKNETAKTDAEGMVKKLNDKKNKMTFNEVYMEYVKLENEKLPEEEQKDTEVKDDKETTILIKKGTTSPSEKIVTAIFDEVKAEGDTVLLTDDDAYYVVRRYDVTKSEEKFDEMRTQLLSEVKGDDFTKLVEEWTTEAQAKLVTNDAAVKRYDPKNIDFAL